MSYVTNILLMTQLGEAEGVEELSSILPEGSQFDRLPTSSWWPRWGPKALEVDIWGTTVNYLELDPEKFGEKVRSISWGWPEAVVAYWQTEEEPALVFRPERIIGEPCLASEDESGGTAEA